MQNKKIQIKVGPCPICGEMQEIRQHRDRKTGKLVTTIACGACKGGGVKRYVTRGYNDMDIIVATAPARHEEDNDAGDHDAGSVPQSGARRGAGASD